MSILLTITPGSRNENVSNNNSTYTFKFPAGSIQMEEGDQVALNNLSMYYSWPSISASFSNNAFSYTFPNSSGVMTTFSVTIPDGFYTVDQLNSFLQYTFIANGHYMTTTSGTYVYFINMSTNSTLYAIQLDMTPIPTSADTTTAGSYAYGWTRAGTSPTWGFPTSQQYSQLIVPSAPANQPSQSFGSIIGFSGNTYPSSSTVPVAGLAYAKTSDLTPQVSPTSSVIVLCSLVSNKYNNPDSAIYSFGMNVTYGSQINIDPSAKTFVDARVAKFNEVSITFVDQDYKPLKIKDTNLLVQLVIMKKNNFIRSRL